MIRVEHQRFVTLVAGLLEIAGLEDLARLIKKRGDLL